MAPDRVAIVYEDHTLNYGELYQRVLRLAQALRSRGVRRGDRVAYLGNNHPSLLETLFATAILGAVFVPLNTRLAVPELTYIVNDSASIVLVYGPEHAEMADELRPRTTVNEYVAVSGETDSVATCGYADLIANASAEPIDEPVDLDDMCMIMYTSGTTGHPKGAVLTHGNITWNCVNVLIEVDLTADEVTLLSAPLFHTAALNMTCMPTLMKGGRVVITNGFDPDTTFDLFASQRITWMFGVPAMFNALAASPRWENADLSSLRVVEAGGAPVPEATIATYQQRGLTFLQGYGMTETAPGALFLGAADSSHKVGSAGKSSFFTNVRVIDEQNHDTEPGQAGEIVVAGPNVMKGYWCRPDDTAASFTSGGWFRTGDVATVDDEGYVYVVDRIKDVIISGGENVYPAEVENVLYDHPGVADVAVIGVVDDTWGEAGQAIVVAREGTEVSTQELLDHCSGRLARYKIPKSVRFTDALPRNASGKLLKTRLRQSHGDH